MYQAPCVAVRVVLGIAVSVFGVCGNTTIPGIKAVVIVLTRLNPACSAEVSPSGSRAINPNNKQ